MVNSMTGYGRCEMTTETPDGEESRNITVEIKSVNHRYLEVGMRVTRDFSFIEDPIKKYISSKLNRGKVDVYISVGNSENAEAEVSVNMSLAKAYAEALSRISRECHEAANDVTASLIARYPDVLTVRKAPEDEEKILAEVMPAVDSALKDFLEMRAAEGERMKADVLSRCETILSIVGEIEERAPQIVAEYKEKLTERINELIGFAADEQRIVTEAAIFADKIAVDEETVRLRSHFVQMQNVLEKGGAVGRKLDFIVQEMNREANTIGSKITDAQLAHKVVDIISELEKIREQIQNIE